MGMWIGRNRKARVTYGFDEIALVPGRVTINPNEVNIAFRLPRKNGGPLELKIPILASAMDGVVDVRFAVAMSKLGGLAVLNLEGVQTRYKSPQEVLQKVVDTDKSEVTSLLQRIYQEPVQPDLIAARVKQIQAFFALMQLLLMPMFFLSGALYPLRNLPAWLNLLTRLDPMTYAVDPMRRAVFAHLDITPALRASLNPGVTWGSWHVSTIVELAIVLGLGVAMLAVAIVQFSRVE